MRVRESFYRPETELERVSSTLPGPLYNLAHLLLQHGGEGCLFVPIRTMHYLAVIDAEECIFVDGHNRREIELAWQHFRPSARQRLADPVPYEVVYYAPTAYEIQRRLPGEFEAALNLLERRRHARGVAGGVVPFPGSRRD